MTSPTRLPAFYLEAEPLTDPRPHGEVLGALPRELPDLCAAIQGLVLNFHWAEAYGVTLTEERRKDAQARSLRGILGRILALDDRPLHEPRSPDARFAGTCRDFTVLLCAALRHQGVAARARCGFAAYFAANSFEDHWVCERWNLRGNLLRDLAALNRMELLPWDGWGLMLRLGRTDECDSETLALLKRVSALTQGGAEVFDAVRALYEAEAGLRVPGLVTNFQTGAQESLQR